MVLPVLQVYGSTGHPTLGVTNTDTTQPTTYTAGTSYVNVTAGSDTAKTDGSVTGFFAINFGTFGGAQFVTFSGAQFSLYLSKDGLAQITASDIKYAGPTLFSVSDLTTNGGWHKYTETNGTFYVGQTTGGAEVITGPLPIKLSNNYKYIKIYDGSTTSVAVSAQDINILPGLTLTPTSGPAGTTVTAFGGGFPSTTLIELTYSYNFYSWSGVLKVNTGNWTTGVNTGNGYFSTTATMFDTKQAFNPDSGPVNFSAISIIAKYQGHHHNTLATAYYNETTRVFTGVISYDSGGGVLSSQTSAPYGNDTSTYITNYNLIQPIPANVLGTINIAGNDSMVNSAVAFWIGTTQVGSSTTNGKGYYNATITIPVLPAGAVVFKVINNGVTYEFNINILPTLVLTPSSGPVTTHVAVAAYGFPASTKWFLYWNEYAAGDATWYQIAHGTTGAAGTFNVTVAFTVPHAYGGAHGVAATATNVTTSSPNPPGVTEATTTFTVTGTLLVCNGPACHAGAINSDMVSINSNTRTLLSIVGSGYAPRWLFVNIDGASFSDCETFASSTGDFYLNFTAAGFAPGIHQVETWSCENYPVYQTNAPTGYAFFNVTTIGAYTVGGSTGLPASVINTINTINTNVNTILGWQSIITGMDTHITTINTNVNTILGWQSTIQPTILGIGRNVTKIVGWESVITGMNTKIDSIISSLTTLTTKVDTAAANAQAASTAATDAKSSVSSTETYVLVVAVLAAITLVLELAILVRKLD
jgi:hypothetical protein